MGTDQLIASRAPAEPEAPRRRFPLVGLMGAALLPLLLFGAIAFALTRPTTYEDPKAMIRTVRDAGFVCAQGPAYTRFTFKTGDSASDSCFLDGLERNENGLVFLIYKDPGTVEAKVRGVRERGFMEVYEGDVWIVGRNWIVQMHSATVSPAERRRMAEALGGDIVGA